MTFSTDVRKLFASATSGKCSGYLILQGKEKQRCGGVRSDVQEKCSGDT